MISICNNDVSCLNVYDIKLDDQIIHTKLSLVILPQSLLVNCFYSLGSDSPCHHQRWVPRRTVVGPMTVFLLLRTPHDVAKKTSPKKKIRINFFTAIFQFTVLLLIVG